MRSYIEKRFIAAMVYIEERFRFYLPLLAKLAVLIVEKGPKHGLTTEKRAELVAKLVEQKDFDEGAQFDLANLLTDRILRNPERFPVEMLTELAAGVDGVPVDQRSRFAELARVGPRASFLSLLIQGMEIVRYADNLLGEKPTAFFMKEYGDEFGSLIAIVQKNLDRITRLAKQNYLAGLEKVADEVRVAIFISNKSFRWDKQERPITATKTTKADPVAPKNGKKPGISEGSLGSVPGFAKVAEKVTAVEGNGTVPAELATAATAS